VQALSRWNEWLAEYPLLDGAVGLAGLLLLALLADLLTKRVLLRVVERMVRASQVRWDDALVDRGVVRQLAHVLPALVLFTGLPLIAGLPAEWVLLGRKLALAWVILSIGLALSALLSAVDDVYRDTERGRERPIKGYLQVAKLVLFIVLAILVVATFLERSPLLLLSGLGALGAVLMLVFRDTILSLVASVQVSSNDMLRVGDWIEMPQLGADGDVIDIALHTVKVQNFDKTITTIPTHRLISESFRNWRGMSESGGRRIMRALPIDQGSVRFLSREEVEDLSRFALLREYLEAKRAELTEWNARFEESGLPSVNHRRLTNLGCFRAYVVAYLQHHPRLRRDMTLLVRQRAPTAEGLPLELYCFTDTTVWAEYEAIQADLFDHLIALLPEFDLRLFQKPGGADLRSGVKAGVVAAAEAVDLEGAAASSD
jgi:miniconductance mechanosensitive channel